MVVLGTVSFVVTDVVTVLVSVVVIDEVIEIVMILSQVLLKKMMTSRNKGREPLHLLGDGQQRALALLGFVSDGGRKGVCFRELVACIL